MRLWQSWAPMRMMLLFIVSVMMMTARAQTPLAISQQHMIDVWYQGLDSNDVAALNWNTNQNLCDRFLSGVGFLVVCDGTTLEITQFTTGDLGLDALIPANFSILTTLTEFSYIQNTVGPFPTEFFANMTEMINLSLVGPFNNSIPTEIGVMSNLVNLWYENTLGPEMFVQVNITLPVKQLETLIQLQTLTIYGSTFHPPPPFSLVNLTQLQTVALDGVDMDGTFPTYLFGQVSNIFSLALNFVGLNGTIPSMLFDSTIFPNLNHLDLSNNLLVGTIPTAYSTSNMAYLDVSSNQLCTLCSIPTSPTECSLCSSTIFHYDMAMSDCNYTLHLPQFNSGTADYVDYYYEEIPAVTVTATVTTTATTTTTTTTAAPVTTTITTGSPCTTVSSASPHTTTTSTPTTTTAAAGTTATPTTTASSCLQLKNTFKTQKCCDYLPL